MADGSEYSSKDSGGSSDTDDTGVGEDVSWRYREGNEGGEDASYEDETRTVELQPVPMSKNAGNRFVAFVWDRELDREGRDELDLHYDRIKFTEDHVMLCRKTNLYNETFNTESMVDILWSHPVYVSFSNKITGTNGPYSEYFCYHFF